MGLEVGWDVVSGDLQGGANSVNQVDRVSDMAPSCLFCGSVWGGFRKGMMASALLFIWEKAIPQLDAGHFSSSLYTTGAFQAASLVLELRGSESE